MSQTGDRDIVYECETVMNVLSRVFNLLEKDRTHHLFRENQYDDLLKKRIERVYNSLNNVMLDFDAQKPKTSQGMKELLNIYKSGQKNALAEALDIISNDQVEDRFATMLLFIPPQQLKKRAEELNEHLSQ